MSACPATLTRRCWGRWWQGVARLEHTVVGEGMGRLQLRQPGMARLHRALQPSASPPIGLLRCGLGQPPAHARLPARVGEVEELDEAGVLADRLAMGRVKAQRYVLVLLRSTA